MPDDQDELEWLALMRHHGAPTRLLDWTKSPYVAAFFAEAEATPEETAAIWAIDIPAVARAASNILRKAGTIEGEGEPDVSFSDRDISNAVFMHDRIHPVVVAPVQPFRTNERVTSQQGLFLCSSSSIFGFELGLKQTLKCESGLSWPDPTDRPESLFKIVIAPAARSEILRELHRMNINYATLFPGFDGFARSLRTTVTFSVEWMSGLSGQDVDVRV